MGHSRVFGETEGKTKILKPDANGVTALANIFQKDTISKGDGAVTDTILGKGALSNQITCDVFELFKRKGIPLAYQSKLDATSFLAYFCAMIPLEVVVRGFATGSYCKRNPSVPEDFQFQPPVVEFFYKTSGRRFPLAHKKSRDRPPIGISLPCDDPLLRFIDRGNALRLYHPKTNATILTLGADRVGELRTQCNEINQIAFHAFKILQKAWREQHAKLIDVKFEFGLGPDGKILLADVVDCDSWRVIYGEQQLSKEPYRQGATPKETLKLYKTAAHLTSRFAS